MNCTAGTTCVVSMKEYHRVLVTTSINLNTRRLSALNYISVHITGCPIVVPLAQNGKRSHILGREKLEYQQTILQQKCFICYRPSKWSANL